MTGAGIEDVIPTEVHTVFDGALVGLMRCLRDMLNADKGTAADNPPRLISYKQDMSVGEK